MRVQAAVELGVEPEAVYHLAALEERRFDDVDARLTLAEEQAVWRALVALSDDEHVGLRLGRSFRLTALGLLGCVLMHAETLEQSFRRYCRYERIVTGAYRHAFDIDGELALYAIEVLGPWHAERKHTLDLAMVGAMTVAEAHLGRAIPVVRARFAFPEPRDTSAYERAFPVAELHFAQQRTDIAFHRDLARQPLIGPNRAFADLFERQLRERLARLSRTGSHAAKVRRLIHERLQGDAPTVSKVADALGTSVRNMQLRLQGEGTSFRRLLDECRRETAVLLLETTITNPVDIACQLGFSEVGSFSRSFRRWTDQTPTAYRRAARAGNRTTDDPDGGGHATDARHT